MRVPDVIGVGWPVAISALGGAAAVAVDPDQADVHVGENNNLLIIDTLRR